MKMRVSDNMKEQKGDLLSVATKFDDLYKVKSNPVNATTTLNAEKQLRDSLVTALGFNGLLLDKTFKELETELKNSIKKELKSGTRLGNSTNVPESVKDFSRAIAAKKIIESGKMLTKTEIELIVNAQKKKSIELFKKSELSLTKPPAPNSTATNAPSPAPSPAPLPNLPSGGNTLGQKIKNAYKVAIDSKIVSYVILPVAGSLGAVGLGVGIANVVAYFSDGTKIELDDKYSEEVKSLINPCLLPLLGMGGVIVPVADGAQLQVKKTGNAEDDSKGGVVYFPNGRAWTMDKSKKGTWSCADIVKEEVMKPVTLKEAIRFRLKNLLNEEVDELQLVQDVDKMVDLLDMYSSADDLKNAFELLTKYSTETINGKNAGKVFLEKYKSAGLGGFVGINTSVSDSVSKIIAIYSNTKYYKEKLLNLVKNIESGKIVAKPTASGKANDSVTIKWDKDSVSDKSTSTSTSSSTQPKQQMTYNIKYDFNYKYGDKSEHIRQIQKKLNFEKKHITGNFGPITQKKLKEVESVYGFVLDDNIGITPDIYKKIMGTDDSQPSPGEKKQTQNTIPYSEPDSPIQNNLVSRGFSDLNAKKDNTAQTGTTAPTETPASTETTPTTETTPAQPSNIDREYIISRINDDNLFNKLFKNIVYNGRILKNNEIEFLKNYISKEYGDEYVMQRLRFRNDKNKERIVFKKKEINNQNS